MFNLNHLSVLTTPQHYLEVVHCMESAKKMPSEDTPDYWKMLPSYLVSRCPFCGQPYHEPLDTYNLRWWSGTPFGDEVFRAAERTKRCKHMFMVGRFINFNGIMPSVSSTELEYHTDFIAEAPHIIPVILGPESTCQAVIHSLPICRIEGDQFVPRYTLYMITYYDQPNKHASLHEKLIKFVKAIPDVSTYLVRPFLSMVTLEEAQAWWDLKFWVEHRKLQWLVPDTPDLPLRTGPLAQFPYGDIEGRRTPYEIIVPPKPLDCATIEKRGMSAYKHKFSFKPEAGKYCLQKQGEMWVVSRTENGQQTYFKEFESESDACRDVFHAVTGRNIVYNVSHGWSMEQFDDDRVGIKRRNSP